MPCGCSLCVLMHLKGANLHCNFTPCAAVLHKGTTVSPQAIVEMSMGLDRVRVHDCARMGQCADLQPYTSARWAWSARTSQLEHPRIVPSAHGRSTFHDRVLHVQSFAPQLHVDLPYVFWCDVVRAIVWGCRQAVAMVMRWGIAPAFPRWKKQCRCALYSA